MAKKRLDGQWMTDLLAPRGEHSLEEFAAAEQVLLRQTLVEGLGKILGLLSDIQSNTARADGRLERLELWIWRKDPSYPLSQRDEPEYRQFRKAVKAYEADKAEILNGSQEED